jgi:hypothetical protein
MIYQGMMSLSSPFFLVEKLVKVARKRAIAKSPLISPQNYSVVPEQQLPIKQC